MRTILFCLIIAVVIPATSVIGQSQSLDTSNQVTPEQVYYQLLHNDSIYMKSFQAVREYSKMRTTSKMIQLVGGVVLGSVAILTAAGEINTGSDTFKVMVGAGSLLFATGWVTDWMAISELNKIQSSAKGYGIEYDKETYYTLFGKRKK